jgi:hypothetical protein
MIRQTRLQGGAAGWEREGSWQLLAAVWTLRMAQTWQCQTTGRLSAVKATALFFWFRRCPSALHHYSPGITPLEVAPRKAKARASEGLGVDG